MKKIVLVAALVLIGATFASGQYAVRPHMTGVSFGVFYSSLDAYGEWISVSHGLYGWRPLRVMTGWRPYTIGRWVWTDDGWYWASDEPWAWAVYHYGRWHYDDDYGWIWIPGYDWAPAWVEWRVGGDYIGWAPLSPYAVFTPNFGIRYEHGWRTPVHYWCFAEARYINTPHIDRYVYRSQYNGRFLGRTHESGNVWYNGGRIMTRGPEREFIEQRTGRRLERADIVTVSDRSQQQIGRDGGRERIQVYRPDAGARMPGQDLRRPERVREPERPLSIDVRRTDVGSGMGEKREESTTRPNPQVRPAPAFKDRGTRNSTERHPQLRGESRRNPERRVERSAREWRPGSSYQAAPRPSPQAREERRVREARGNERASRTDERRSER